MRSLGNQVKLTGRSTAQTVVVSVVSGERRERSGGDDDVARVDTALVCSGCCVVSV